MVFQNIGVDTDREDSVCQRLDETGLKLNRQMRNNKYDLKWKWVERVNKSVFQMEWRCK